MINFRVYSDREYTFNEGLNIIVGANGVGKSTLLESIGIVLFNAPKTSLKDAIQRGKEYSTIYLETDTFKVRRSFGSLIEYVLEIGEERYEGKDTVLAKLSQLLGIPNLESFWSDVLTIKQFSKLRPFDGTPNERVLLFGRILGIERYEHEFIFLKDVLAYGKRLIDKLSDRITQMEEHNQQAEAHNENITEQKNMVPSLQQTLKDAQARLTELQAQHVRAEAHIRVDEKRKRLQAYLAQLELKATIPAIDRVTYKQELETYSNAKDEYFKKRGMYASKHEDILKRLRALEQTKSYCPVCGQSISENAKQVMIADLKQELRENKEPVFTLKEPPRPQRFTDDGLEEEIVKVRAELETLPIPEIVQVEDVTKQAQEVASLVHQIKDIEALSYNPIVDLAQDVSTLGLYRDAYDKVELYRKGIKDKISTIPVEARKVISQKADRLYQDFMRGHHEVGLTLDNSYGIVATIRGNEIPFSSLGGAESVTAALAIRLALAYYLARDINLLFLDEATDALDHKAQRQMVDIIENLEGQVFVVTHESVFTKGNVIEI